MGPMEVAGEKSSTKELPSDTIKNSFCRQSKVSHVEIYGFK